MTAAAPVATYRVQLNGDFGFADARRFLDHLVNLGVSHLYLSPVLAAVPGSNHGYDVVDTGVIDAERGGAEQLRELLDSAADRGLGVMIDIVPNHMAAHQTNPMWMDVLRHGLGSTYAPYFDVMWDSGSDDVGDRLLLPVLGAPLDDAIASGDVRLGRHGDEIFVCVYEHRYPLADTTLDSAVQSTTPADLRRLLDRQHYELAYWREANVRLDRRRFFDVTELIGVRQEDDDVREATHRRIEELCNHPAVDGLRVDHPDGLTDPTGYVRWLRERMEVDWIVVEKILGADEPLPDDWPVDGTTGYDQSARIDALFVDPRGRTALDTVVHKAIDDFTDFDDIVAAAKRQALGDLFGAERRRLHRRARSVAPDASVGDLAAAVDALVVAMPHYRTYVRTGAAAEGRDRTVLARTAAIARAMVADTVAPVVDRIVGVFDRTDRTFDQELFVVRYQQLTSAVTAKGVEDTAFYRYPRLLTGNEVGADPGRFGCTADEFHAAQAVMACRRPLGLVSLSTHDSKRSGDARHRLAVLSEIPDRYDAVVGRLRSRLDAVVGRGRDPVVELTLIQMVLAAYPIEHGRMQQAALKAAREAKRRTSWYEPDEAYEQLVAATVDALLDDAVCQRGLQELLADLVPFGRRSALSATAIAATVPGVLDIYQGTDIWSLSLADPDNRRPLDMGALRSAAARPVWSSADLERDEIGASKWHLLRALLGLRRSNPEAFGPGAPYAPRVAQGSAADHVIAFDRGDDVITVAARWERALDRDGGWRDTAIVLPPGRWRDVLSGSLRFGGAIPIETLLSGMPCAVLTSD
ncbi:MAG: malto-oligosyltrehalose synthase [Acidimicrobiia bacterium]